MKTQNLLLLIMMIVLPISAYLALDWALQDGLSKPAAPTGFMTLQSLSSEWDSYDYTFFSDSGMSCAPDATESNPRISSFEMNDELSQLSYSLALNAQNELEKASMLFDYVSQNILYATYTDQWRRPSEVLQTLDGDCTDKSILLVSLLKQAGIEAYVVYGGEDEYSGQHAWVIADINDKWFQMDPTSQDIFYIYKCKGDEACYHNKYYNSVLGVFGPEVSLKCNK